MVDLFDILNDLGYVLIVHILKNKEGERALVKILQHILLTLDRVKAVGQIVEHIVIDAGKDHSQH